MSNNRTMKMDQLAGSGNDEFYTPAYAIEPIIKYLEKGSTVWCPFDTEDSEFVKGLRLHGFNVINTHIWQGQDFFEYEPEEDYDYIISNPPYSLKNEVLTRLYELEKPFAILVGVVGMFESKVRTKLYRDNGVEVLYLTSRVQYFNEIDAVKTTKSPPFQSGYFCYNLLPKEIMLEDLNKSLLRYSDNINCEKQKEEEQISLFD